MRRIFLPILCVAVMNLTAFAQADKQIADEVIAITKAQWAADLKQDVATSMKNVADEYTEFNPDSPFRIDGKAMSMRIAEAVGTGAGALVSAEMANEKVQVYGGDVAILTYNFIGALKDKDGNITPLLTKSTRVYAKESGQWKLVHANFAPAN